MALPGIGIGHSSTRGILMILLAVALYGFGINLARPLQQRNGALAVVWRALAIATLVTAPLGVPALADARWEVRPLLAIVALGAVGTAVANVAMAMAVGRLDAPTCGACARSGRSSRRAAGAWSTSERA